MTMPYRTPHFAQKVKKAISVTVDPELVQALRKIAVERNQSVSSLVELAIAEMIKHFAKIKAQDDLMRK